ncbi:MAG: 4Fe-4S binding protein [Thermoguttaceae bacterium]
MHITTRHALLACCIAATSLMCGDVNVFAQRNPPPVFESAYQLPVTATPAPHVALGVENGVAVALYAMLIVLAIVAVHNWRSRRVLFAITILSVAVLGFVLKGCPCPVGTLQSIAAAVVSPNAFLPVSILALFLMPLVAALFYGRVFCGSVCPIGAVQELVCLKPVLLPTWLDRTLSLFRYVYLGIAVLLATNAMWFLICRTDPVVSIFRMSGMFDVLVFGAIILLVGVFVGRPYCRFLCPYGVLLGWCSRLASRKVSVTPGDCSKCKLCETSCPYQAILAPTTPPSRDERRRGPWRLLVVIVMAPFIVAAFGFLGSHLTESVAAYQYDIRLAERIVLERDGLVEPRGAFAETRAWMERSETEDAAIARAAAAYKRLAWGTTLCGVWIGFVVVAHAITLTTRRRRENYEVDPTRCVACGRCFWYCPNDRGGRLLLDE